jgi:hypothetical protein
MGGLAPAGLGRAKPDSDTDVRFVGSINGRYTLASRRDEAKAGRVEVFACRVLSISPESVAVTAPVSGATGEKLTSVLEGIGIVTGTIERQIADGFVFEIEATDEERAKLAAKIRWLKGHRTNREQNRREHPRFPPKEPRSLLKLADGKVLRCMLIDVSRSGAAVSADVPPVLGMKVMVGTVPGNVVRLLDVGFAVQFDEPLATEVIERRLCLPERPPVKAAP